MEICKICGKEFKQITLTHVKTHGLKTMDQYEKYDINVQRDIEPTGNTEITPKEMSKRIWGEQERDTSRPLSDFLKEFDITEKELRAVTRKYKDGKPINPIMDAANRDKMGEKEAAEIKDQEEVTTFRAETAESLQRDHNYILKESYKGPPKRWVLCKKK